MKASDNSGQSGVYGIGQRSNYKMWAIRGFWDRSNYRRFRSQHWGCGS